MRESEEGTDIVKGGRFLEAHGRYQAEVIRYDTIPYDTAPPPNKQINHCTMPKHSFLFKKRIMSTFLGLMLLLLAATISPALENNLSDGTDVPHVPWHLLVVVSENHWHRSCVEFKRQMSKTLLWRFKFGNWVMRQRK